MCGDPRDAAEWTLAGRPRSRRIGMPIGQCGVRHTYALSNVRPCPPLPATHLPAVSGRMLTPNPLCWKRCLGPARPGAAVRRTRAYNGPAALLAQLVEHLHGKEGVDGSSPSEGFGKAPANTAGCRDRRRRSHVSAALGELRPAASEKPLQMRSCSTLSRRPGCEARRGVSATPDEPSLPTAVVSRTLRTWRRRTTRPPQTAPR